MESTNLHHHQLQQDQPPTLEPSSSSTITTPSSFHGSGLNHSWTPNIILNNAGGNNNPRSRADLTDNNDMIGVPQRPLIQDLGYHHQWTTTTDDAPQSCLTTSKLLIKEEIFDLPKFSCEMLNIPSTIEAYAGLVTTSTTTTTNHMNNNNNNNNNNGDNDLNEKLLLKNFLSGDFYSSTNNNNNAQNYYYYPPHIHNNSNFGSGVPGRGGNFSQIYPSINISNNSRALALVSSPMEESLDLLSVSSPPSRSFTTTAAAGLTHQHLATFADNLSFRLDDHMQHHHTIDMSSCTSTSNNASLPNGTAVAKRPCSSSTSTSIELEESSSSLKASHHHQYLQTASKKSRSESRPSSSPPLIKVRKEKLGDRIAALQQLVAPFGKTDTASVLMEAIGYIQFLQSQVETLSVPYMKSSQNQSKRVMQGGSGCRGGDGKDLRSRGLCLVPLSCMSYIAADAATDNVWQHQPNFGGAT